MKKRCLSRKGQVAIFVIIAIVLVAGIVGYFLLRGSVFQREIPAQFLPVYEYYTNCLEENVLLGSQTLASQGGYIELPAFEPGNEYAPFSNQMDFFGTPVAYWYYITSNGLVKEQIPSINEMESELEGFLEDDVGNCNMDLFFEQGFDVSVGPATANVNIKNKDIEANIKQSITIEKIGEEESEVITINNHNIEVKSNLGSFYEVAKNFYEYEMDGAVLENYVRDVLYLYAPVSGAEMTCEPLVWNPSEVFGNLSEALEANIDKLKVTGGNYKLNDPEDDYFVMDIENVGGGNINFLYDSEWPSRFEVWPTSNNVMIANPSLEQGISSLGFCYNAYKFVYDIYIPVVMQVMDENGEEIFNVPMAVVIDKNNPRESIDSEDFIEAEDICENANSEVTVYTYNNELDPLEADISFECLTSRCPLGKTEIADGGAKLVSKVPACINGELIASAEGYSEKKYTISTNEENFADIVLDKEYELGIEVYVDGSLVNDQAILYFESEGGQKTIVYPQQNTIILDEGQYDITAQIIKQGNVVIPAKVSTQCTTVKDGVAGFFGFEEDKCFDVQIPSVTLNNVISGGGNTNFYAVESELEGSNTIKIYSDSFPTPNSVEDLQNNYLLLDGRRIDVELV